MDVSGLLLIDKPAGISSFDIIRKLRRQTGIRKFGHAGTLDPAATGLMLILVGSATKIAGELSGLDKTYETTMILGATSTTGDREGEIEPFSDHEPSQENIESVLKQFTGPITQTPSKYSAIKVGGVRAYKLARQGKEVEMPPREVIIYEIVLNSYEYPEVKLTINVSSGTYIRTLAEDIGSNLKTGAYLNGLRRTKVGDYSIKDANQIEIVTTVTINQLLVR